MKEVWMSKSYRCTIGVYASAGNGFGIVSVMASSVTTYWFIETKFCCYRRVSSACVMVPSVVIGLQRQSTNVIPQSVVRQ